MRRRFTNPKILEFLKKYPVSKHSGYNWKTIPFIVSDNNLGTLPKDVQTALDDLQEYLKKERDTLLIHAEKDFDFANQPSWIKKRKKETLPDVSNILPSESNAEDMYVLPFVRQFSNTLFPSDWAKQCIELKKKEGEFSSQFWSKIVKDLESKDGEYKQYMQKVYDDLTAELGAEKTVHLKGVLENARTLSLKNFEEFVQKYQRFNDTINRKLEKEAKVDESKFSDTASKEQIEEANKILKEGNDFAFAHLNADWKADLVLQEFQGDIVERYVNTRLMKEFDVDPTLIKEYDHFNETSKTYEAEWRSARETAIVNAMEYYDNLRTKTEANVKEIAAEIAKLDQDIIDLETKDVEDYYKENPEWLAKVHWLIMRGRWDANMTDEEYRHALAEDHTWFNLPRNP